MYELCKYIWIGGFLWGNALWISTLGAQVAQAEQQMEQEIQLIENLLAETEGEEKQTLADLKLINRQISLRRNRVRFLTDEIARLQDEIIELDVISCQMEEDLFRLENDFRQVARTTYLRFRTDNFWLALLSAGSISELYYRTVYFREFSRFRRRQIEAITHTRTYLAEKTEDYKRKILLMQGLITEKASEVGKLQSSRQQEEKLLQNLQSQASTYQQELNTRRSKLKQLIKASEQTYISASDGDAPAKDYALRFPKRKGLLSWPVLREQSVLTGSFGVSEDPFGNRIVNDGIYLQTVPNLPVRAVFDGTVTAVTQLPLSGAIVIVEHGDYRSVYANLSNPAVKVGDAVVRRQILGSVRQDPRSGESILNFLIYQVPETFLDPEDWLVD